MVVPNYWVVLTSDGKRVLNVVLWDGENSWEPPAGCASLPYDPDLHPDIGLDVDVGLGWRDRIPPAGDGV